MRRYKIKNHCKTGVALRVRGSRGIPRDRRLSWKPTRTPFQGGCGQPGTSGRRRSHTGGGMAAVPVRGMPLCVTAHGTGGARTCRLFCGRCSKRQKNRYVPKKVFRLISGASDCLFRYIGTARLLAPEGLPVGMIRSVRPVSRGRCIYPG